MRARRPIILLLGASILAGISPVFAWADDAPVALPEVIVNGKQDVIPGVYNSKVISLPKYTGPLLDTPQAVTIVPSQVIQDQGATTLRDVLHSVSGISVAAGEGGSQGDSITIRGFTARTDFFLDGMRNFGSYYRDPFDLEQVEVLKGPAGTSFGRGSTGGAINQESKTPQVEPFTNGSLAAGSDGTKRATADINGDAPSLGENTYFRLNLMTDQSNVAGRNVAENRRFGMAPSLAFGLGTANRTTLSYYKQTANDTPDYGIPFLFNKVAPVNRTNYYGYKNENFLNTDVDIFTLKNENDVNANVTVRHQLRYATYMRNVQITEAKVPATTTVGTPIETITVDRNQLVARGTDGSLDYDVNVTAKFDTGTVHHTFIGGAEAVRETTDPTRYKFTVQSTSLLDPQDVPFTGTGSVSSITSAKATTLAAYVQDTLILSDKWEWTEQLRYDYLESYSEQTFPTSVILARFDNMLSSRGALVYKPVSNGSIYLTYATSFNPSIEQLSLSANNVNADPEKNRVYELGTKWSFYDGSLNLSSALFMNEKLNARTPDPNNPLLNVLDGDQKVQGIEVEASGNITKKWQIFAGYTYAGSEVTKSNTPSELGSRLANAPLNTASIWSTYELSGKWQIGGGVKAVSDRIASTTPDVASGLVKTVDGYMVYDAMAKYQYAKDISLQMNLYNLDDKFYIDGVHSGHSVPGVGRSLLVTSNFNF